MADVAENSIVTELKLKFDQFIKGITQDAPDAVNRGMAAVHDNVNRHMGTLEADMAEAGKRGGESFAGGMALMAGAAATAFLEKFRENIEKGMEYAHEMLVLRLETGDSYDQLQRLQYAFASVGVSSQRAQYAFMQFQYRIQEAAQLHNGRSIFERMGLDPRQMQTQDIERNLQLISDKFRNFNAASQSSIARQLFGRTGFELLPLLNQGSTGLQNIEKGAGSNADLAKVDDSINKLNELHDKVMQMAYQVQSAWMIMIEPVLGAINKAADAVTKLVESFQHLSAATRSDILFGSLMTALTLSAAMLAGLRPLFSNLVGREVLQGLSQVAVSLHLVIAAGGLLYAMWRTDFAGIREVSQNVFAAISTAAQNFHNFMAQAGQVIRSTVGPAMASLETAMRPVLAGFANLITQILSSNGAWSGLLAIVQTIAKAFATLVQYITTMGPQIAQHIAQIIGGLLNLAANADIWQGMGEAIGLVVVALETVGDLFNGLLGVIGALLDPAGQFKDTMNDSADAMQTLQQRMDAAKDSIKNGFQWVIDHKGEIEFFFATVIGVEAIKAINGLKTALAGLNIAGSLGLLAPIITAVSDAWGAALIAFGTGAGILEVVGTFLGALVTGLTAAFWWVGLIVGAVALLVLALTHWKETVKLVNDAWDTAQRAMGQALQVMGEILNMLDPFIPGLGRLGDVVSNLGRKWQDAADAADRYRENAAQVEAQNRSNRMATDEEIIAHGGKVDVDAAHAGWTVAQAKADLASAMSGMPTPEAVPTHAGKKHDKSDKSGSGSLSLPAGPGTAKDVYPEQLREMTADLKPLEEHMKAVADQVAILESRFKALGNIDASNLNKAVGILQDQVKALNAQSIAAGELHKHVLADIAKVEQTHPKNAKDRLDQEDKIAQLKTQQRSLEKEQVDFTTKRAEIERQIFKLKFDTLVSEPARLANELRKLSDSLKTANEDFQKRLYDQNPLTYNFKNAGINLPPELLALKQQQTQGVAGQSNIDTANKNVVAATNAWFDWQSAMSKSTAALNDYNNALAERDRVRQEVAAGVKTQQDLDNAEITVTQTHNALTAAEQEVIFAHKEYGKALQATDEKVLLVRNGFDSLAKQVGGPLYTAFEEIRQGVNPLVALFLSLFSQSKSYHDIQVILTRVATALAKVFDALRPVLDFLLGVLVGVVNVFLMLFNMIATVLNVFGLHIEKIKMVSLALNDMNNAAKSVPLLQITHDLPTFNEYNQGHWKDLIAQNNNNANNLNDTLQQGFSSNLAKLGEILGILVAIRVLIALIGAHGVISSVFGGGGILNSVGKLFGLGKSSEPSVVPYGGDLSNITIAGAAAGSALPGMSDGDLLAQVTGTASANMDTLNNTLAQTNSYFDNLTYTIKDNNTAVAGLNDSINTGSGATANGLTGGISGLQKGVMGLGDAFAVYNGFKQGGIMGGISAGFGAEQLAMMLGATGPVGMMVGAGIGLISAIFGGNHDHATADEKDTVRFGTDVGELLGNNTHAPDPKYGFKWDPNNDPIMSQTGGKGLLPFIEGWISSNLQGPNAALAQKLDQMFGHTGGGLLNFGHDIGQESVKGGNLSGTYATIHDAALKALNEIMGNGGGGGPFGQDLNDLLHNATNIDLSQLFGSASITQAPGGGWLIGAGVPGGSTRTTQDSSTLAPTDNSQTITINIQNLHGSNPNELRRALEPVVVDIQDKLSRLQAIRSRTDAYQIGRGH